ncbi:MULTISPECIES: hypothetical protein [Mesorhizobium]|uniref:hypothetical protein n=1 Tax=Mesorhizobium TaxID=68287 RepID=UPI00313E3E2F
MVAEAGTVGGQDGAGVAAPVKIIDRSGREREAGKGLRQGKGQIRVGRGRIEAGEHGLDGGGIGQADRLYCHRAKSFRLSMILVSMDARSRFLRSRHKTPRSLQHQARWASRSASRRFRR